MPNHPALGMLEAGTLFSRVRRDDVPRPGIDIPALTEELCAIVEESVSRARTRASFLGLTVMILEIWYRECLESGA